MCVWGRVHAIRTRTHHYLGGQISEVRLLSLPDKESSLRGLHAPLSMVALQLHICTATRARVWGLPSSLFSVVNLDGAKTDLKMTKPATV